MTAPHTYITTTIPYVNARPHIGFALELVQADVLARHRRGHGDAVRFQAGTDDNSLKNVLAAEAAGVRVEEFVDRNAEAFLALGDALSLSVDDVIRTSRDPRHRPGVERFWRACAASRDLYRRRYQGLYCTGCEQFYQVAELRAGRCPEHGTVPQAVAEENWFFRLSRYAGPLREAISTGRLRIEPAGHRREVLAFIDAGLEDFSVSRPAERSGGWGIPVPGDPGQVIYVWFDALCNYVTALGYGVADGAAPYRRWWDGGGRRIHLLGQGVLRFHAVYWPAMLLSSGQPLPTGIFVHDYLTAGGRKISKSSGAPNSDPAALAAAYSADAVRWWLLREVPRTGDADFTVERLSARADDELANGLGNLVNRVVAMIGQYRRGRVPAWPEVVPPGGENLDGAIRRAGDLAGAALDDFDFRQATAAVWAIADEANRFINRVRPWELARAERGGDVAAGGRLDAVLGVLLGACSALGRELAPFLPDAAARIAAQCTPRRGRLPDPVPVFRRLAAHRWLPGAACLASVTAMSDDVPDLRASHEDRDRVVDVLRIAGGDGRLSPEELDTRLESALSARTLGELAELTADLPAASAAEGKDVLVVEQHGGRYVREGRWPVPARIELRTQLCRVTFDFTHAVMTSNVLRIQTDMVHGKLFIVTSPDIVIDTDGLNLTYSKLKLRSKDAAADPRLRIELSGKLLHAKVIEQRP